MMHLASALMLFIAIMLTQVVLEMIIHDKRMPTGELFTLSFAVALFWALFYYLSIQ